MSKTILVTGGAGYIGSHFSRLAVESGYQVVVLDNLSKGYLWAIPKEAVFVQGDIQDFALLVDILQKYQVDGVVHFAASIEVGESQTDPLKYYENNTAGTIQLLKALHQTGVKKMIFSSTAATYGMPEQTPITEQMPNAPINNYGRSKLMMEDIMRACHTAYSLDGICFRYFNAAGAHPTGEIGEAHNPESHLIPLVLQTALGLRESISVYGNDYPTTDGTCIRDYIHIQDLVEAHLLGLEYLFAKDNVFEIVNLGTETGNSVLEIIELAKKITQREIKIKYVERRDGDPAILVASNQKAQKLLNWKPKYDLENIITDAWRWHLNQSNLI